MPTIDLSTYHQPPGTGSDGTKFDNALDLIQSVINSIDNNNFGAGKIFDPTKIMQGGAVTGQALVWNGTNWAPATSVTTYRKVSAKQVVNTVVETDLLNGEITIGAGALGASGMLRLTALGDLVNNTGAAQSPPRFKVKLGATTLLDTGASGGASFSANANRWPWRVAVEIVNLGATNAQSAQMRLNATVANGVGGSALNFTTGVGTYHQIASVSGTGLLIAEGINSGAVDTTVAQALVLSVINGVANASYDVTLKSALVEVL